LGDFFLSTEENKTPISDQVKAIFRKMFSSKKRVFVVSWSVIPIVLIGLIVLTAPNVPAVIDDDSPDNVPDDIDDDTPVTIEHPQFHIASPSADPVKNCSVCHTETITISSCEDCHSPLFFINNSNGNVTFPHHNSSSIAGSAYACGYSQCHNASADFRVVDDTLVADHAYCDTVGCHDLGHDETQGAMLVVTILLSILIVAAFIWWTYLS
jgi:hypothetical protein